MKVHNAKLIFSLLGVVLLFVGSSLLAHRYEGAVTAFFAGDPALGMIAYVLVTVVAVVAAPFSSLPLVPLASMLWGWRVAGLLSLLGWVVGAQIAFVIARRFGAPLVRHVASIEKLSAYEKHIPPYELFSTVVLLRMVVPVDILSYILGLFSRISYTAHFWATLVGVTPFSFVFAYAGTLRIELQLAVALAVMVVLVMVYLHRMKTLG